MTATLINGSQLWLRELVDDKLRKIDYAYHYQGSEGKLRFRYDNAPHHVGLSTYQHHKHLCSESNPQSTEEKTLIDVVNGITEIIRKELFKKLGRA